MTSRNKKRKNNQRPQAYPGNHSFRLFVAVEVPSDAISSLVSWQDDFLSQDPALRLTPSDQLHITLAFIGAVGEKERDLALAQMGDLTERSAFEATVRELVGLPRGKNPRVIAARVEEPQGRLEALHGEVVDGLVEKGIYKREKRPFLPHVTIARARGRTSIDLAAIGTEPIQFTAVRVTLYNSILKPSGALHKALKSVQLTNGG